jgi:hypothetical protein
MNHSVRTAHGKQPLLRRFSVWPMLCLIATMGPLARPAEAAAFVIRDVRISLDGGVYELDANLVMALPDAAQKAIESGLTLRLTYEIVVDRVRRYIPDAEVAALQQRYEVAYHALSQRYLVRNLNTGEQQDFGSLQGALDRVSELRGLPILDTALLAEGPTYEGRIRAVLKLNSAPDVLGWLLFWTDDWSQESDWAIWTLRP